MLAWEKGLIKVNRLGRHSLNPNKSQRGALLSPLLSPGPKLIVSFLFFFFFFLKQIVTFNNQTSPLPNLNYIIIHIMGAESYAEPREIKAD